MREIRTLGLMRRGLETGYGGAIGALPLRKRGATDRRNLRAPRQSSTLLVNERVIQERSSEPALLHHVSLDLLRSSYQSLKKRAAAGVDGMTWEEYGENLEERLADLHGRIHRGVYQAKPSRRVWIPKADGRQRPLGIATVSSNCT